MAVMRVYQQKEATAFLLNNDDWVIVEHRILNEHGNEIGREKVIYPKCPQCGAGAGVVALEDGVWMCIDCTIEFSGRE